MDVKSTLKVIDAAPLSAEEGVTKGQTIKRIVGHAAVPTDRVRIGLATYEAGSYEQLHWHPIEAYYFVVSGHATVRDIEGREYPVGPGSSVEWDGCATLRSSRRAAATRARAAK